MIDMTRALEDRVERDRPAVYAIQAIRALCGGQWTRLEQIPDLLRRAIGGDPSGIAVTASIHDGRPVLEIRLPRMPDPEPGRTPVPDGWAPLAPAEDQS